MSAIRFFRAVEREDYQACKSGPCRQGRRICPFPEACQLPEPKYSGLRDAVWIVVIVTLMALAAAFVPPLQ